MKKHLKFVSFRKVFFVMNNGIGGAEVWHAKCEISFARGEKSNRSPKCGASVAAQGGCLPVGMGREAARARGSQLLQPHMSEQLSPGTVRNSHYFLPCFQVPFSLINPVDGLYRGK